MIYLIVLAVVCGIGWLVMHNLNKQLNKSIEPTIPSPSSISIPEEVAVPVLSEPAAIVETPTVKKTVKKSRKRTPKKSK